MITKLLIMTLGIFLTIAAGSCNLYPLYLTSLKQKFNYSLTELNLYASFINIGHWFGLSVGIIYDKFGPRISCLVSLILLPGSYGILNLILRSSMTHFSIFWLLILGFVMGQGSSLVYTTAMTTNIKNFNPAHSSSIVGIIVSNMAIAPSIFTSYREALPKLGNNDFFVVVSIYLVAIIALCIMIFQNIKVVENENIRLRKYERYKEKNIVHIFIFVNILILFFYVIGVIVNGAKQRRAIPNVVIFPLLECLNFLIVALEKFEVWDKIFFKRFIDLEIKGQLKEDEKQEQEDFEKYLKMYGQNFDNRDLNEIKDNNALKENNLNEEAELTNIENKKESNENKVEDLIEEKENSNKLPEIKSSQINDDTLKSNNQEIVVNDKQEAKEKKTSIKKILLSTEIILFFVLLMFLIGSVISNLVNVEFIASSMIRSPTPTQIFQYAILYFSFNAILRIITGILLSWLIRNNKLFHFLVFITCLGLISQILGAIMNRHVFYLSIALAGSTHGCMMTFVPIYCRIKYNIQDMGKILGFLTTGNAIGALIISCGYFGVFFEKNKDDVTGECFGSKCFRTGYIINSVLIAFSLVISLVLCRRNSKKVI